MKKVKTPITTLLLLVVFIGAFLSQSLSCLGSTNSANDISFKHHQTEYVHSSLEVVNSFGNDLFENETEDDYGWFNFILPYGLIDIQFQYTHVKLVYNSAIAKEITNPIYIMVCNFRV